MKQQQAHNGMWLYNDNPFRRIFVLEVYLPDNVPFWPECTNEEKEQWEEEHKQPEPEPEAEQ